MSDDIFYPIPTERKRGITRWILLALHALIFAGVVIAHPELTARFPEIMDSNLARLGIPIWGLLLILHLLLTSLIDIREGIVAARIERRRRDEYRSLRHDRRRENLRERTRSSTVIAPDRPTVDPANIYNVEAISPDVMAALEAETDH